MSQPKITVETTVKAPVAEVWRAYTTPADIEQWNAASDDWHTTAATVDLRPGGAFSSRTWVLARLLDRAIRLTLLWSGKQRLKRQK